MISDFLKNISPVEILILALIIIALFGSKIALKLGRTSGQAVKEVKKVKKEFTDALKDDEDEPNKS